jgi:hypothetical protein
VVVQKYGGTSVGNTFLRMKRSGTKPNVFGQEIGRLTPGRLFSLKMITSDYRDLVQEKSSKATNAVTIQLDNCNVVWDSPSKDAHGWMPFGNGDVGINTWVEPSGDLALYVNKTDAWDENGRLCKIRRVRVKFDPP